MGHMNAEIAIYHIKQLLGDALSLRHDKAQVSVTYSMIGIPEIQYMAYQSNVLESCVCLFYLDNTAC